MTDLIYLNDCYAKETDSVVTTFGQASDTEFFAELDVTPFYPEGGGQPSDTGYLEYNNEKIEVYKVSKKRDAVKHWIKQPIPADAKVRAVIDWPKRYFAMKQHTAQHLISAIALNRYGSETVGNKLKQGESRIDLKPLEWNDETQNYLETEFNKAVDEGHEVSFEFVSREEMMQRVDEKRRKLFERLPSFIKEVRLVIIKGIDIDPCAGTHVKNTNEVGHIKIIKTENKGSGTRRIYYTLE